MMPINNELLKDLILQHMDVGLILYNDEGQPVYFNQTAEQYNMMESFKKEIPLHRVLKGEEINEQELVVMQSGKLPKIFLTRPKKIKLSSKDVILVEAYDFSKYKWEKHRLEVSEIRYKSLFEQNPDIVCWLDTKGNFISVNPAAERITGYYSEELLYKNFTDFIILEERERGKRQFEKSLEGEHQNFEITILHKDQDTVDLNITFIPVITEGHLSGIYIIAKDITKRKKSEEMIHYLAYHDTLTGLPNRRLFNERLLEVLELAKKNEHQVAVMFIDLDRFKYINDTLGHTMGDLLLKKVAIRLKESVREGDTISRIGGDEFTIILSDATYNETEKIAQRILQLLSQPIILDDQEYVITPSIGISIYPNDGGDIETLIKHADTAMYHTKEQGKNNYKFYTEDMNQAISRKMLLEKDLRKALNQNEFEIYYQPQVNSLTGEVIGSEALIRWKHPNLGLISPAEFIPLAEETGLIIPIGEWVLNTAIAQNKAWQTAGLLPMKVAVNLSITQFQDKKLVNVIQCALKENQLDPQYLELEITESVAMTNVDYVISKLKELKKLGVQISIDDFGTGYSSLNYLKEFPIDTLKIDQSFIRHMSSESNDAAIVKAIIAMAQSLHLNVIAEGVEKVSQMNFLCHLNCNQQQGYLFSKPVTVNDFAQTLNRLQTTVGRFKLIK